MATASTARMGPVTGGMHTAGIYSDMTVDGPEIGTLVLIVDRAKNLPNRKTMGKQDPYCAARLGKEAKKTDTDRRGGQVPRWDQELRFTVHDSPDYYNIKVSIFNDDKKTDLIGETWVGLEQVVIPGGGRNDTWHTLNYRGKYAGEIRLEISYYDSRPPERSREVIPEHGARKQTPVKRRPLPGGPAAATPSPDTAKSFGPRDMSGRSRGATPESTSPHPLRQSVSGHSRPPSSSVQQPYQSSYDGSGHQEDLLNQAQPDFLPQIPVKGRNRDSMPQYPTYMPHQHAQSFDGRQYAQPPLPHSHSAPDIHAEPQYGEAPYANHSQQMTAGHGRYISQEAWTDPYQNDQPDHYALEQGVHELDVPPPPPTHSSRLSSQQNTPARPSHRSSVPNLSPLQSIERGHGQPPATHAHPSRGHSIDDYGSRSSPARSLPVSPAYGDQQRPSSVPHNALPPPVSYQDSSSPQQAMIRHSISDPYNAITPPRAHPLSQEVRRSASPQPYYGHGYSQGNDDPREYHFPDDVPIVKPRAISPQPGRRSIAAIQHPVQTYAARAAPTPEHRTSTVAIRQTPMRKSISPHPSPNDQGPKAMPFSPDSFDAYNPASARNSPLSAQPNPHSPYHIPSPPKSANSTPLGTAADRDPNAPIVGWDGRVIDPSDHLPVDSWAPEPEQKVPMKPYGSGSNDRSRGFGPRTTPAGAPRSGNLVVNVRSKGRSQSDDVSSNGNTPTATTTGRNRLFRKSGGSPPKSPVGGATGIGAPLREIDVPNPYAQQQRYSDRFSSNAKDESSSNQYGYDRSAYRGYEEDFDAQRRNSGDGMGGSGRYRNALPPPKPPKVPISQGYGVSALSQEIASIDIGGGSARRAPNEGGYASRPRYGN